MTAAAERRSAWPFSGHFDRPSRLTRPVIGYQVYTAMREYVSADLYQQTAATMRPARPATEHPTTTATSSHAVNDHCLPSLQQPSADTSRDTSLLLL